MILRGLYDWPSARWRRPTDDLVTMRRQMENLFDGFFKRPSQLATSGVYPLINLTGDKDNYYLRAEIPGLKSDELEIQVTSNTITLSGERKIPTENENAKYHRREREAGTFSRGISLPGDVNPDKVEASLKDGMLTVVIPKAEAAKPKQITVK